MRSFSMRLTLAFLIFVVVVVNTAALAAAGFVWVLVSLYQRINGVHRTFYRGTIAYLRYTLNNPRKIHLDIYIKFNLYSTH